MANPTEPMDEKLLREARELAGNLLGFLDASPSAWHAVAALRSDLDAQGFEPLDERLPFVVKPGGRYYVVRDGSALVAFIAGKMPPSVAGFRMIGAHTDSPTFKLKPRPELVVAGLVCLGVEIYGGPVVASWLDGDLGLCGRVVWEDATGLQTTLYRSGRPILAMPGLAIHMNREVNEQGLKVNPQTELLPILGAVSDGTPTENAVRVMIARDLALEPDAIRDFDLLLYDTRKAAFAGWNDEFILSGRLDDLAMCHAAIHALLSSASTSAEATRLVACVDSEEVGSQTATGARSNLLPNVLERIGLALGDSREGHLQALARSFLVSADNAHAVHPGYESKSEPRHAPRLNGGPVVKAHASRSYATDAPAAAAFEAACRRAEVPCQRFVNRSDVKSGGTIGSMTAAQLGVATVDVGAPQLSMHSVREMAGSMDPWFMTRAMESFLRG